MCCDEPYWGNARRQAHVGGGAVSNATSIICPLLGFGIIQHAAMRKPDIVPVPPHTSAATSALAFSVTHAQGVVIHCFIQGSSNEKYMSVCRAELR